MKNYVMITGAAGGLGKAFAAECASRGWNLFLTDISQEALNSVALGLERMYEIETLSFACDLTNSDERKNLWEYIKQADIHFHFLVNIAGLDYEGPFDERQVEELRTIIRLNIESTVETTRSILSFKADKLHIINVSSFAAFFPMPIKATYAASKRFILDWSLALNEELHEEGVSVTALCPSGMPTNDDNIRAIDAQGMVARFVVMDVGDVAAQTVDAALAGKTIFIPGLLNQILRGLLAIVPSGLIAFFINKRWRETTKKSHSVPNLRPSISVEQL